MIVHPSRRGALAGAGLASLAATKAGFAAAVLGDLRVVGPMTENVDDPIGVQLPDVRLSWRLETARRGTMQSAYQIQVASSTGNLKTGKFDLWDSGRIAGDQSFD